MSLDIVVRNRVLDEVIEINWLRNPFGLERWAEDNYRYATRNLPKEQVEDAYALWEVVNNPPEDRGRFLEVVRAYREVIGSLTDGYFWFDARGMMHYVLPIAQQLPMEYVTDCPTIYGAVFFGEKIGLPMGYFNDTPQQRMSLILYQQWFQRLYQLAVLFQHPESTLSVSA